MDIQDELFRRKGGRANILSISDSEFVPYQNADGKWGYKLKDGDIIIIPQYLDALTFNSGLAPVRLDSKYGYINHLGDTVIPFIYEDANVFHDGLAMVKKDGISVLIDTSNYTKIILNSNYKYIYPFSEGYACVLDTNNLYGFIDDAGKEVIKTQYGSASSFKSGMARVCINGKFGYVNKSGKLVIPAIYCDATDFNDFGYATVDHIASLSRDIISYKIDINGNIIQEVNRIEGDGRRAAKLLWRLLAVISQLFFKRKI